MKLNHSFLALALVSTLVIIDPASAAEQNDPLLTEKSQQTFQVDFDGLPLSLPTELKDRVLQQVHDNKILKSLGIGNVDLAFNRVDPKTNESKLVKGWIEGEAFKISCSAQKELDNIRKILISDSEDTIKVQHIVNDKFKGYIVNWAQASHGRLSGLYLQLIDTQKSTCHTFSLAIEDFDGFTTKEIKDAASPLTDSIKRSFFTYTSGK